MQTIVMTFFLGEIEERFSEQEGIDDEEIIVKPAPVQFIVTTT